MSMTPTFAYLMIVCLFAGFGMLWLIAMIGQPAEAVDTVEEDSDE